MILVTGAGGLLGSKLIKMSQDFVGTYHSGKPRMDITSRKNVFSVLEKIRPSCVVHCAALTDVDYCEDHKEEAHKVNVLGTKNIADACKAIGSKMVYLSTDFVFDGKKGRYKETDQPNPTSVYSSTKLMGEHMVAQTDNSLICRASVLYGAGSEKFVQWVIDSLNNNKKIYVATDQFASPTLNTELAECMIKLIDSGCSGIYHTAGSERISRYDFAKNIAKGFSLDNKLIEKTLSDRLKQRVRRPMDSSLNTDKIKREIGFRFSSTKEGLKKMKAEIDSD